MTGICVPVCSIRSTSIFLFIIVWFTLNKTVHFSAVGSSELKASMTRLVLTLLRIKPRLIPVKSKDTFSRSLTK